MAVFEIAVTLAHNVVETVREVRRRIETGEALIVVSAEDYTLEVGPGSGTSTSARSFSSCL